MGFLDKLFGKDEPAKPAAPEAVAVVAEEGAVFAPVTGTAVALADTSDPVFSSEAMGKGIAIEPDNEVAFAPISGEVTAAMGHAFGITGDDGIEALVHVGIDTVSMNGAGFTPYAKQGDRVKAGQPVLGFSKAKIAEAGYANTVFTVITNTAELASVEPCAEGHVDAGQKVVVCKK